MLRWAAMRWPSAVAALLLVCGGLLGSSTASAAPRTPARKSGAEADVSKANKALAARSFGAAAEGFEAAYEKDRNPKWLFEAARARQRNGDLAQAATHYARFLESAPESDKRRATAKRELASIGPKVGRLEIKAEGASLVTVDGAAIDATSAAPIYVSPGGHLVEARFGEEIAKESATARAGEAVTVVLTPPAPPPPPAEAVATPVLDDKPATKERRKPLPPLAVWIGAGATVVAGGLTIVSGLDVLHQKDAFDAERSRANLDAGKDKQLRTNILIGVTGAAAVLTGVAAIWLVDWHRGSASKIEVGAGPSSITIRGAF